MNEWMKISLLPYTAHWICCEGRVTWRSRVLIGQECLLVPDLTPPFPFPQVTLGTNFLQCFPLRSGVYFSTHNPLSLSWPCELLWPLGYGKSDNISSGPKLHEGSQLLPFPFWTAALRLPHKEVTIACWRTHREEPRSPTNSTNQPPDKWVGPSCTF